MYEILFYFILNIFLVGGNKFDVDINNCRFVHLVTKT